jgi:hypothetical protein
VSGPIRASLSGASSWSSIWSRPRTRPVAAVALGATLSGGCETEGVVEIAWRMVDRGGNVVFPSALFAPGSADDTCALPGTFAGRDVAYTLRMALEICAPCESDACVDACESHRFACDTHRGSLRIPAHQAPYRFRLVPTIEPKDPTIACAEPEPTCVTVPGPRERRVQDGLVTDLEVYQVVLALDSESGRRDRLDLEACGCA